MSGFFRSSGSSILVFSGTCALLVLIVIVLTGGFTLTVGPVRFSAHSPGNSLVVAVLAWGTLALRGWRELAGAAASLGAWLDRFAPAIAVVVACAAAGAGVAFGSYAAGAADSSGYVSQSDLLASGRISRDEPLARVVSWREATWAFSPLGYRPGSDAGVTVPTYPPGLPLVMAGARLVGGEDAAFLVVPVLGALAVFCTFGLGARLHSPVAGIAAALLLATSPIFLYQLVQPMSDVPVTAWFSLALLLAILRSPGTAFASGVAAGLALLTRPNLFPLVGVAAVVVAGSPRLGHATRGRPWHRLAAFAAAFAPALIAMVLLHVRLYGSLLASGYGSAADLFAWANVWPNILGYASRLARGEGPALVLTVVAAAVLASPLRRRAPEVWKRIAPSLVIGALVGATVLACYLPYFAFAEWSYLRFLLPAFPAALVLVGALIVAAAATLPAGTAAVGTLAALTAAGSVNVNHAQREEAFNLHRYEARYRDAGRYLAAALPPDAVIVALQESGSARYYAGRPVVRWDMLRDLDAAVADLTALGLRPVLVVEDWEESDLRARFPGSALAGLDWPPLADIGSDTRVRVFVAAHRAAPLHGLVTDRFP